MHYRPSRQSFRELLGSGQRLRPAEAAPRPSGQRIPVAACLPLAASAQDLFEAIHFSAPCILLESARNHPLTGRWSMIVGEPTQILSAKVDQIQLEAMDSILRFTGDPLALLQERLDASPTARIPGFPPFVGGAVGVFGFDATCYMEPILLKAEDDLKLPDLLFLFCDQAIVLDHLLKRLWVIALTSATGDPNQAYDEAVARVDTLVDRCMRSPVGEGNEAFPSGLDRSSFSTFSTHTRASFEAMVRRAKEYIAQGQIYQANLSQRFAVGQRLRLSDAAPRPPGQRQEPWTLYRRLSQINPSPFAAFADLRNFQVISASPERFLRVRGNVVETRPIAGTRPKGKTAVETARLRQELILNEKERAEHLMLVDLERNDLGRVCRYGSVRVDEPMVLEEYSHVIHIVSNVRGTVRSEIRPVDLLAATFPGGTITGCPKIRSIQIIDELEPVRRQLYTGSLGYLSYTGDLDLNLLIRTAFVANDSVYVQTGAGIVADSDPGREFEETLHKAQALMEALHAESPTPCERVYS